MRARVSERLQELVLYGSAVLQGEALGKFNVRSNQGVAVQRAGRTSH